MVSVYVLQSETTGRFYVGQTRNLAKRLQRHLSGRTRAARGRGPWRLIYSEVFPTRPEAVRREREIKRWKSHRYLQKLAPQPSR